MYIKRHCGFWMTFNWSKNPFLCGLLYSIAIRLLFIFLKSNFKINIALPRKPIVMLGIPVAFYLGLILDENDRRLF